MNISFLFWDCKYSSILVRFKISQPGIPNPFSDIAGRIPGTSLGAPGSAGGLYAHGEGFRGGPGSAGGLYAHGEGSRGSPGSAGGLYAHGEGFRVGPGSV